MAPIPTTVDSSNTPAALAAFLPWLMWLLIIIISLLTAVLLGWVARRIVVKITKTIAAYKERQEDAKLALPTHLDSFAPRVVVLPLPYPQDQELGQIGEDEKTHEEVPVYMASVHKVRVCSLSLSTHR
jgi:uncharacterized membrane protein YraQ (UPF0718 family)